MLAIFVLTDDRQTQPIILPLAHAHRVVIITSSFG